MRGEEKKRQAKGHPRREVGMTAERLYIYIYTSMPGSANDKKEDEPMLIEPEQESKSR